MIDNIVSILNHKSIKNKKEYLQRYALNREDTGAAKTLLNTMNKLIKSKVNIDQGSRLNLTINPSTA